MTSTAAAASTSSVTPGRPSTTRVTILTGRRMTDLVLPAAAPIETYIDETVSVLGELMEDTPKDVLAGFDFSAQGVWAFARPGAPPLKANESLDDAGVVDGSLLTLVSVSRTERYRPLVEDVIDAIAVLDESPEFDRTALNRFVGLAIPVATLAITVMSLVAWSRTGHSWYWPVALGVLGLAVLGGTVLAKKSLQQHRHDGEPAGRSRAGAGGRRCIGGSAAARGRFVGRTADCGRRRGGLVVDVGDTRRPAQACGVGFVHGDHVDRGDRGGHRVRIRVAVLGAGREPSPSA